MSTDHFYDTNAEDFFSHTVDADLSHLWQRFTAHLPASACILDAGCGSGRDAKAFTDQGFAVTAIDSSAELVKRARQFTGLDVLHMRFEDMPYRDEFDGLWTNACLLHYPSAETPAIWAKCIQVIKPGGVWYMSYKQPSDIIAYNHRENGVYERYTNGRHFTDIQPEALQRWIDETADIAAVEIWTTRDARPGYNGGWVNAIARKNAAP